MKNCYTTKAFADIYDKLTEDELRSGKLEHETLCICNESGTTQVNLTNDEAEEFEKWSLDNSDGIHYWEISSDTESDLLVSELIEWLEDADMLEPIAEPDRARCPSCGIPTVPDHEDLKPEAATCNECHALGKPTPSKVSQLAEVWEEECDYNGGLRFVTLDGVHYRVSEPTGTEGQFYAIIGDQYAQRDHGFEKALQEVQLLELVPELLAALQECITEEGATCFARRDTHPEYMDRRLNYISEIARAAIAKATAITHPTE
jgi:hypothetical protein